MDFTEPPGGVSRGAAVGRGCGLGLRPPQGSGAAGHPGPHTCTQKRPPRAPPPGLVLVEREGLPPGGQMQRNEHVEPEVATCPLSVPLLDPGSFHSHM